MEKLKKIGIVFLVLMLLSSLALLGTYLVKPDVVQGWFGQAQEQPVNPDTPNTPDVPDKPDKPDKPNTPEKPVTPVDPNKPFESQIKKIDVSISDDDFTLESVNYVFHTEETSLDMEDISYCVHSTKGSEEYANRSALMSDKENLLTEFTGEYIALQCASSSRVTYRFYKSIETLFDLAEAGNVICGKFDKLTVYACNFDFYLRQGLSHGAFFNYFTTEYQDAKILTFSMYGKEARNIYNSNFENCPNLETLDLGFGIELISTNFETCPNLKNVIIRNADRLPAIRDDLIPARINFYLLDNMYEQAQTEPEWSKLSNQIHRLSELQESV